MSDSTPAPRAVYQQEQATTLLQHYLRRVFDAAGLRWDPSDDIKVADIVECIVDAAAAKADSERRDALGA